MVFITNSAIALRSNDLTVRVSVILRKNVAVVVTDISTTLAEVIHSDNDFRSVTSATDTVNSPSQDHPHQDDETKWSHVTPGSNHLL